jgi:rhomboid protease GluP
MSQETGAADTPWVPKRNPLHEVSNGVGVSIARAPRSWPTWVISIILFATWVGAFFIPGGPTPAWAGVSAEALRSGRFYTPLTYMFVHAGLWHLWMNVSALVVGEPVVRQLGNGVRGRLVFFGFFLVCGVLAGLGYAALDPFGSMPAVGASGAICGLWGAAARLDASGPPGSLVPLRSRAVASHIGSLLKQNLILVTLFVALAFFSHLKVGIAWQAHVVGFAAGLLLIGPALRLARRDPTLAAV